MLSSRRLMLLGAPAMLTLSGCGGVVKSAMNSAVGAKPGSDVVDGAAVIKQARRLVVAGFMVDYVTEFRMAKAGNVAMLMFTDTVTNATIKTVGVDPARLPGLTDTLYDGFVAEAVAAGYEIVPHATLAAQPGYAAFRASGKASPATEDGEAGEGIFVSARDLPLFYLPEAGFGRGTTFFGAGVNQDDKDAFLPGLSRFGASFALGGVISGAAGLAKSLDATAVMVRVTIAGGTLTGKNSFWTGADVSTGAGISFAPFVTRLAFLDAAGSGARIALGTPVVTADIGELKNVTSTGTQIGTAALNTAIMATRVAAAIAGGSGMSGGSRARDYEYRIDPAKFEPTVIAGWQQASRRLLTLARAAS